MDELTASCGRTIRSLHALVNCAGVVRVGPVASFAGSDWDDVIEVNLRVAFELVRALEPALGRAAASTSREAPRWSTSAR